MAKRPTTRQRSSSADPVTAYAKDVAAGKIVAGPDIRAACRRHLRDLKEGKKRGLKWDLAAAQRVFRFFETILRLNGGEFEGKPFRLQPWQAFIVGSIFGWKGPDGHRRFRVAYVETGKGSGKSPLAAGIGLYMLTADDEPRAEVYAAATKKDQAMVLFRDAVAMVDQSPALAARLVKSGINPCWNLAYLETGSFFRPISSDDGQSGPRPHCALIDEVHEHKKADVVELMRAGTKGRRQALIFMITNSGSDRTSVCYSYHEYGAKVAAGELQDDSFFAYICGLDEGDDPFKSEECWPKSNPSLGVTFQPKYLREQVTQARGMPAKEAVVRRLNFCEWTDAAEHWIGRDLWEACQHDFDPDDLVGLPCWLGLDLSSKRDLTALAVVWKHEDETLSLACWFWTPGDTLDERARQDRVPYRQWMSEGHLFAPPGRIIDKGHVAAFVEQLVSRHDVQALAYDQAQIDDFQAACDQIGLDTWIDEGDETASGYGLRMRRHGQGYAGYNSQDKVIWMPRSIERLEEAVVNGRLRVRPNPVLTWNSASAVLTPDPQNNRKWDKRKATGRIDGMVAATMAVGAALEEAGSGPSVYEQRGILVI